MPERGGGKVQLLVAVVATLALGTAAYRIVPVYVRSYAFRDAMRQEIKYHSVNSKSLDKIKADLSHKAVELRLPLSRDDIKVRQLNIHNIAIAVQFSIPIDLVVTQYTPKFVFNESPDTAF